MIPLSASLGTKPTVGAMELMGSSPSEAQNSEAFGDFLAMRMTDGALRFETANALPVAGDGKAGGKTGKILPAASPLGSIDASTAETAPAGLGAGNFASEQAMDDATGSDNNELAELPLASTTTALALTAAVAPTLQIPTVVSTRLPPSPSSGGQAMPEPAGLVAKPVIPAALPGSSMQSAAMEGGQGAVRTLPQINGPMTGIARQLSLQAAPAPISSTLPSAAPAAVVTIETPLRADDTIAGTMTQARPRNLPLAVSGADGGDTAALAPELPASDTPASTGRSPTSAERLAGSTSAVSTPALLRSQGASVAAPNGLSPVDASVQAGVETTAMTRDRPWPSPDEPVRRMAPGPVKPAGLVGAKTVEAEISQAMQESPAGSLARAPAQADGETMTIAPDKPSTTSGEPASRTTARPARPAGLDGIQAIEPKAWRPMQDSSASSPARTSVQGEWQQTPVMAPMTTAPMQAVPSATATAAASSLGAGQPHDFATLVERLVEARDAAVPQPVHAAIAHAEFGKVTMRFEQDSAGMSVTLSSADPDFAVAVQAAAPPERHDASSSMGASGQRQESAAQPGTNSQSQPRQAGDNRDRPHGDGSRREAEGASAGNEHPRRPHRNGIFA